VSKDSRETISDSVRPSVEESWERIEDQGRSIRGRIGTNCAKDKQGVGGWLVMNEAADGALPVSSHLVNSLFNLAV